MTPRPSLQNSTVLLEASPLVYLLYHLQGTSSEFSHLPLGEAVRGTHCVQHQVGEALETCHLRGQVICSKLLGGGSGWSLGQPPCVVLGTSNQFPQVRSRAQQVFTSMTQAPPILHSSRFLLKSWRKKGRGQSMFTVPTWKFFENHGGDHWRVCHSLI